MRVRRSLVGARPVAEARRLAVLKVQIEVDALGVIWPIQDIISLVFVV